MCIRDRCRSPQQRVAATDFRKTRLMNAAKRAEIFRRLCAANPAPTTELEYATTFQLLVAVILSAQATDKSVNLSLIHI